MSPHPLISALLLSGCAGLTVYDQLGETADCDPAITPDCGLGTTGLPTGTATGMAPGDEVCDDGADNNDDGLVDCEDPTCLSVCDADGDGHDALNMGGDDCNDADDQIFPGQIEACDEIDNNCDTNVDEDTDGDGVDPCSDCDETDATIYPGAYETCGDYIDSDCDSEDCLVDWVEDFETGVLGAHWNTGGNVGWTTSQLQVHEGSWSAMNGNIGNSQTSWMRMVVDFPAGGSLEFWHAGSTEAGYDYLRLFADGVQHGEWSGSWYWTFESYPISAGQHLIEWQYDKDISESHGSDTVYVDLITLVGGTAL